MSTHSARAEGAILALAESRPDHWSVVIPETLARRAEVPKPHISAAVRKLVEAGRLEVDRGGKAQQGYRVRLKKKEQGI